MPLISRDRLSLTTRRWVLGGALLVALFIAAVVARAFWPLPPATLEIGRDTTYLDGPVLPDGTIDYLAALDAELRVAPEDNALIPLLRAMGPRLLWDHDGRGPGLIVGTDKVRPAAVLARLGLEDLTVDDDTFRSFPLPSSGELVDTKSIRRDPRLESSLQAPWKPDERPHVHAWLEANGRALARIEAASWRPAQYLPLVSTADPPSLMEVDVVNLRLRVFQQIGEALASRSLRWLGVGDVAGTWADLATLLRLSRQRPLNALLAPIFQRQQESLAHEALAILLERVDLDAASSREWLKALQGLRPRTGQSVEMRELRILALAELSWIWRAARRGDAQDAGSVIGIAATYGLDDSAFRIANRWFDRVDVAMERLDGEARIDALAAIKSEHGEVWRRIAQPSWAERLVHGTANLRSRISRDLGHDAFRFGASHANVDGTRRVETRHRLLLTAIALEGHRAEHGEYPLTLEALAPAFLAAIPSDPYEPDAPLRYRRAGSGYELSSLGAELSDNSDNSDALRFRRP